MGQVTASRKRRRKIATQLLDEFPISWSHWKAPFISHTLHFDSFLFDVSSGSYGRKHDFCRFHLLHEDFVLSDCVCTVPVGGLDIQGIIKALLKSLDKRGTKNSVFRMRKIRFPSAGSFGIDARNRKVHDRKFYSHVLRESSHVFKSAPGPDFQNRHEPRVVAI